MAKLNLKSKTFKIIIAINVVVIALVIGAIAFFSMSGKEKEEIVFVPLIFDPGDAFITNINGSDKLLKTDMTIEYQMPEEEAAAATEGEEGEEGGVFDENKSKIRDLIIVALRQVTPEDVAQSNAQDEIKARLIKLLNEDLDVDYEITNIYFEEFLAP